MHALLSFSTAESASPIVVLKISLSRALNHQNKHRNTKQNNMAAILEVFVSFPAGFKRPNFGFSFASFTTADSKPIREQRMVELWLFLRGTYIRYNKQWNSDFLNLQGKWKLVRKIGSSKNRRWHQIRPVLPWNGFIRSKKADNNGRCVNHLYLPTKRVFKTK